ncbi:hypothetical protein OAB57_03540, partial [Bacteriovoracaceae bacterium]|nr:hypothetical protein [Bacteriovoracaceae bacterium]
MTFIFHLVVALLLSTYSLSIFCNDIGPIKLKANAQHRIMKGLEYQLNSNPGITADNVDNIIDGIKHFSKIVALRTQGKVNPIKIYTDITAKIKIEGVKRAMLIPSIKLLDLYLYEGNSSAASAILDGIGKISPDTEILLRRNIHVDLRQLSKEFGNIDELMNDGIEESLVKSFLIEDWSKKNDGTEGMSSHKAFNSLVDRALSGSSDRITSPFIRAGFRGFDGLRCLGNEDDLISDMTGNRYDHGDLRPEGMNGFNRWNRDGLGSGDDITNFGPRNTGMYGPSGEDSDRNKHPGDINNTNNMNSTGNKDLRIEDYLGGRDGNPRLGIRGEGRGPRFGGRPGGRRNGESVGGDRGDFGGRDGPREPYSGPGREGGIFGGANNDHVSLSRSDKKCIRGCVLGAATGALNSLYRPTLPSVIFGVVTGIIGGCGNS